MLDYQKVRLAKLLLLSNGHLKTWPVIGATVEQDIFFWSCEMLHVPSLRRFKRFKELDP